VTVNYNEPGYDPFGDRGATHYQPTNEAARRILAAWLVHRNVQDLCAIHDAVREPRQKKLCLKYMMMELLAFDGHLRRLVNMVNIEYKDRAVRLPLGEFRKRFAEYRQHFDRREKDFRTVRNTIAAHSGEDDGGVETDDLDKAWDLLTLNGLNEIFAAIPPLFASMRSFPLATWTKLGTDGEIAFVQPNPLHGASFVEIKREDVAAPTSPPAKRDE